MISLHYHFCIHFHSSSSYSHSLVSMFRRCQLSCCVSTFHFRCLYPTLSSFSSYSRYRFGYLSLSVQMRWPIAALHVYIVSLQSSTSPYLQSTCAQSPTSMSCTRIQGSRCHNTYHTRRGHSQERQDHLLVGVLKYPSLNFTTKVTRARQTYTHMRHLCVEIYLFRMHRHACAHSEYMQYLAGCA